MAPPRSRRVRLLRGAVTAYNGDARRQGGLITAPRRAAPAVILGSGGGGTPTTLTARRTSVGFNRGLHLTSTTRGIIATPRRVAPTVGPHVRRWGHPRHAHVAKRLSWGSTGDYTGDARRQGDRITSPARGPRRRIRAAAGVFDVTGLALTEPPPQLARPLRPADRLGHDAVPRIADRRRAATRRTVG